MQRSRKALLQRRALEKAVGRNRLFKVSLSVAIVLWGLVFLLNLWISYGDSHLDIDGGGSTVLSANSSTLDDTKFESTLALGFVSEDEMNRETCGVHSCQSSVSIDSSNTEETIEQQIKDGKEISSDVSGSESQQVNMEGGGLLDYENEQTQAHKAHTNLGNQSSINLKIGTRIISVEDKPSKEPILRGG